MSHKKQKRKIVRVQWDAADEVWLVNITPTGVLRVRRTKAEAIDSARLWCRKEQATAQLVIHKKDGKIQTEYTYGADPRRSKG